MEIRELASLCFSVCRNLRALSPPVNNPFSPIAPQDGNREGSLSGDSLGGRSSSPARSDESLGRSISPPVAKIMDRSQSQAPPVRHRKGRAPKPPSAPQVSFLLLKYAYPCSPILWIDTKITFLVSWHAKIQYFSIQLADLVWSFLGKM
jgi:hypothetical protein